MQRLMRDMRACVLAIMLTTLLLAAKSAQAAPAAPQTCGAWSAVTSPNVGSLNNNLFGVAAVSASDVWAVGAYINGSNGNNIQQTLIEHWNGTSWSVVPSPNVGTQGNGLLSVAAISASDIWAVGHSSKISHLLRTLIEHWNGTSWSVVPSPNVGVSENQLLAVAAVSSTDVWAVGTYSPNNTGNLQTLTLHWDGTQWSVVPSPNPGTKGDDVLFSVAAVSGSNVWAVGYFNTFGKTLIEHWNGTQWSVVSSPNPSSTANGLHGVVAVSASNIWAVGDSFSGSSISQTLTLHWNGTKWSAVPSPNPGSSISDDLYGVAAISASNIWAVGDNFPNGGVQQTLAEHWNGTNWSIVASPSPGANGNDLLSVTSVPGTSQLWAVGYEINNNSTDHTLIEFFC